MEGQRMIFPESRVRIPALGGLIALAAVAVAQGVPQVRVPYREPPGTQYVAVTATQLAREFERDARAALERYAGQPLEVTGELIGLRDRLVALRTGLPTAVVVTGSVRGDPRAPGQTILARGRVQAFDGIRVLVGAQDVRLIPSQ